LNSDNYWVYHKAAVEDSEQGKLNPQDKLWQIVKFVNSPLGYGQKVILLLTAGLQTVNRRRS